MSILTLYHGSNIDFCIVSLKKSRNRRDFGRGFYTTTIKEQAEQWAHSLFARYGGDGEFLYTFQFDWDDSLSSRVFDGLTSAWLEMVKNNRTLGGRQHDFDVVKGPVANDDTMPTIALYVDGSISEAAALVELAFFKANDQVSLHTEKALKRLTLVSKDRL
jgi:hypothetical protein